LEHYISAKEARTMDSFIHYGIAAAAQAVADAGLPTGEALDDELATRIACVIGSGIGGLPMIEQTHVEYTARGPRRISPFFVPASIINMIVAMCLCVLVSRALTWLLSLLAPQAFIALVKPAA
jgi:3-oxoacyl-[acyl-carrier-protein] synthase II